MSERDELIAYLRVCSACHGCGIGADGDTCTNCDDRRQPNRRAADLLERDGAEIARLREAMKRQAAAAITLADATNRVSGNQLEQARKMRAESQPEMIESERAANARLTEELDAARAALDDVSAAIGTNEFMDPPDGGSPSLSEQVRRMRAALAEAQRDAERYRLMRRNPTVDGESLVVVEVLEFNEDGPTDVYYAYAGDPLDAAIDAAIAKEQSHASE